MARKPEKVFTVYAAVLDWYDGDTFYGAIDHGGGLFEAAGFDVVDGKIVLKPLRCRSAKIQAAEMEEIPTGELALADARRLAPPGIYQCETYKNHDTYGRPLIDLILPGANKRFSEEMILAGHARVYR